VEDGEKLADEIEATHLEISLKARQGLDDLLHCVVEAGRKRAAMREAAGPAPVVLEEKRVEKKRGCHS
jgi:hypothetical protein